MARTSRRTCSALLFLALSCLLFALGFGPARVAVAAGPICTVGASGANYTTVQAAINDSNCATINIAAGTYTENITINRDVILQGAGPFVQPQGAGKIAVLNQILCNAVDESRIRRLEFHDAKHVAHCFRFAVELRGDRDHFAQNGQRLGVVPQGPLKMPQRQRQIPLLFLSPPGSEPGYASG